MVEHTPTRARVALGLISLLCAFGVGVGIYMTWHHELSVYGPAGAFGEIAGCAEAEGVSCDVVNTSAWSELLGVPQFTWAIPMYLTLGALALWGAARERSATWIVFALAVWSAVYSGFLAYISKVELQTWCLWCIRLYATNAAILVLAGIAAFKMPRPTPQTLGVAAAVFALTSGVSVGAQKAYRGTLLAGGPDLSSLPADAVQTTAKDPVGPAPVLTWQVKTEDGNDATLTTSPTDAWKGNPQSKVAIVEFADFECGYCKRASGELKRLHEAYGDRVLFVYKHFPMDPACNPGVNNKKHKDACLAAEAGVCAQEQGVFWAFHDLAFKNQHELDRDDLLAYARKAGVDESAFTACMQSGRGKERVVADATHGKSLDLHGTPRIWVNGQLYRAGQSAEQMARALELALGASAQEAESKAGAMRERPVEVAAIPADVPASRTVALAGGRRVEVDTFEAAVVDGAAQVGVHQIPATRMSWFAARDACAAAGRRLCTEEEWFTACQGSPAHDDDADGEFADDMIEGTTYPYGDYHDPSRCWDGKEGPTFRPVYTAEMPGCASRDGVYDLTGNVEEWVGATPETAVLLGGAWDTSTDHARCARRNTTFGPGYASLRTGFRCCR